MRLPSRACDFFQLTATEGHGTGESFAHFPIRKGDCLLADRGYSTALGIRHVAAAGAHVTVRVNPGAPVLRSAGGEAFDWPESLRSVRSAGAVRSWTAEAVAKEGRGVPGRVYALRKTDEAIRIAQEGLRQRAARKGKRLKPHDLEFAKYVIVFTTFPAADFSDSDVLEWYRIRWQVELVFKRFKSLAQLGHLAEAPRRKRPGLAVRQAAGSSIGGEADLSCARKFPLGLPLAAIANRPAPGLTADS